MGKPLKYPELQSKFEKALVFVLAHRQPLSGKELLEAVKQEAGRFAIGNDELGDLLTNSANYFGRAKQNDVLVSHGRHRGYSIVPDDADAMAANSDEQQVAVTPLDAATAVPEVRAEVPRAEALATQQWESFLHFPASLVLARRFGGRVHSLPKVLDRGTKWGNPDMLMVRSSPLETLEPILRARNINVSEFRVVDDSPEAILSSIELKFGLRGDRRQSFQAVTETAANSLWANEAWLVFAEPDGTGEPLDRELLALARNAEIGILEIVLQQDDGTYFDVIEHQAAVVRPRLRVSDLDHEQRIGLLTAAHNLLVAFKGEGTFLDTDGNAHKARLLIHQALGNLKAQVGFGERNVSDSLSPMLRARSLLLQGLVQASLDQVSELVAIPIQNVWADVDAAIRKTVVVDEAEKLQRAITELRRLAGEA